MIDAIHQALRCGEAGCTCTSPQGNVHCPAHEDTTPSLSVTNGGGGKPLVKCFGGCSQDRVIVELKARDLWPSKNGERPKKFNVVKSYDYQDAKGNLVFQVCRLDPKDFRQRRPDGVGGWVWKMTGVKLVPYRLSQVLQAETVYIVEGEKDADRLATLGLTATTNPGGAGKWRSEYNRHFQGKQIIVLPDHDPPGKAHALDVARNLRSVAASVKVIELPGIPEKGDVSDWLAAGGTVEQLLGLVEAAPEWKAQARPVMPEIRTTKRFLNDISNEAIQALETANHPPFLFRRAGGLVRISRDEKNHPKIINLTDVQLRGMIARSASFFKETEKGLVATAPPMDTVKDILALGEWSFPALEGLVQAPVMRPDGTVFTEPGYDPQTRLYYVKPDDLFVPPIPENPSTQEVQESIGYLLEIVCDFPFAEDSDRANAVGLVLTLPLRAAILGNIPMAVITSPTPGTGKTLLQDAIANIGTGQSAPMAGLPRDDDEMRKFITSRLLSGEPLISFDNQELPLWGASLSRALTCTEWEDRLLGGNTNARLPQRAVWIANGNNLKLKGDLPRRTFPIRLDSRMAKPWERDGFKHRNLTEWILQNRGNFLAAIFVLARAWFVAGKPEPEKPVPVMGNFEAWAETIGGILAFAGVEGFLENLAEFHAEADLEGPEWEGFLTAWVEAVGHTSKTCQEVAAILRDNSEFVATLPDNLQDVLKDPEKSFERSLGRTLAKKEKRPYGENNLALQRVGTHKKAVLWKVAPLSAVCLW